jgi:uncharacterized protein YjdB
VRRLLAILLIGLAACGGDPTGSSGIELVRIASPDLLLGVGASDSLEAIAIGTGGSTVTTPITWRSTAATVATVTATGRVNAVAPGVTEMIASAGGRADTVQVTVHGPLQQLIVTIDQPIIKSSDTTRVRAIGRDAGGRPVPVMPEWTSGDTAIAVVAPNGLVLGLRYNANTTLVATAEGITGFVSVSVIPSTLASIRLLPAPDSVGLGTVLTLTAEVTDEFDVIVTDRVITWTSTNPDVISVNSSGQILAVSPGTATVRATVDGLTATESFFVSAIPENVYQLEVTNHLLVAVRVFVNDSQIVTLGETSSGSFQLPKVPLATVRWQLIRPKAGTAGEPLTETFPAFLAPDGVLRVEIDNIVNGLTYFTPQIRSLVPGKFDIDMPVRDLAGPCGCSVSDEEDVRRFGYWPVRTGSHVLLIRTGSPANTIAIPVSADQLEPRSGIWRTTVLVAP